LFSDIAASFTDIFGGNSETYQNKMDLMYKSAKDSLMKKAVARGANAIVGFKIDFDEISGKGKGMLMLSATGTACLIEDNLKQEDKKKTEIIYAKDFINRLSVEKAINDLKGTEYQDIQSSIWDKLMEASQLSLIKEMLRFYNEDNRDKIETYVKKFDRNISIPYLYGLLPEYDSKILEIIFSCNLFDTEQITKLADKNLSFAIKLLSAQKDFYTCTDITEMKALLTKLDNLPDKGEMTEAKLGLFGKEQETFICPNGHKNNKNKEFCSICGKNIKGLNKNEVDKIEQFRNKIKVLTDMIAGK
jgi:uncharacterized protein YbjQ (UPF0145 family)